VVAICAVGAILVDLIARRPHAAIRLNTPLVVITIAVWFAHLAARARQGRWSVEVRGVTVAGSILALAAIYETISDRDLLGPFDAEPFAMLVFAAALGWFVLTRAREQEFSYVALSRELELARSIQQSLLPQCMPDVPGLRIEAAYLPMSAVAPPLLRRANARIEQLDHGGIVLTLVPTVVYATVDVAFEPGDRLLLYTDGLTEAARAKGDEFFGDAELARVLTSTPASDDLMAAVLHAHRRWIGEGAPVSDDVSVVVIERVEDGPA
jgi:hypothetical protein